MLKPFITLSKTALFSIVLVAICAFSCGAQGTPARLFPGAATVIEGEVTTADGRPVPHASVYLMYVAPSQFEPDAVDNQNAVVSDDKGHFRWNVPDHVVILPDSNATPPPCWMLAADRQTSEFSLHSGLWGRTASTTHDLLTSAVRECRTRWIRNGPSLTFPGSSPFLSVVAPDMGSVNLVVRGPDGEPLRGHAVQIFAVGGVSGPSGAVVYDEKTDANGRLSSRWYPGLYRLQLLVRGVGFGSTGSFEVLPGATVTPAVPPLAPFAQISGSIDRRTMTRTGDVNAAARAESGLTDSSIQVGFEWRAASEHRWFLPSAAVDAQGHWTLKDVLPGEHQIVLNDTTLAAPVEVTVRAGEIVSGIRLGPRPLAPSPRPPGFPRTRGRDATPVGIRGMIKDTAGRPVPGTTVYAICAYSGIRVSQEVLKAMTGDDGRYVIPGVPFGEGDTSFHLVAVRDGYAAAESWGQAPADSTDGVRRDLVLPPTNSRLSVRVLSEGKPVANAHVRLSRTGTFDMDYSVRFVGTPESGKDRDAVDRALRPELTTDNDGHVAFSGLTPGLWDIAATDSDDPRAINQSGGINRPGVPSRDFGNAEGVAVRAGETCGYALKIYRPAVSPTIRILGADGKPPADPTVGLSIGTATEPQRGNTSMKVDSAGDGHYDFGMPGLWRVDTRIRDVALTSIPANAEPHYAGEAVIALSPSVPMPEPVIVRSSRRGPGSIRVRLEDASGHPVLGTVTIGDVFDGSRYAGSVNGQGEIVFPAMTSGSYTLLANSEKPSASPRIGHDGDPFPSDAELTGVSLFAPQTVTVAADRETSVTLRRAEVGYIRGKLRAAGRLADYGLIDPIYAHGQNQVHLDRKSGEFVAGPFAAGTAWLSLMRSLPDASGLDWSDVTVAVAPGKITHVTLAPQGDSVGSAPDLVRMKPAPKPETYRSASLAGSVVMPDGATPAWGARLMLFAPHSAIPALIRRTDAAGQIIESGYGDIFESWSPLPADLPADNPPGPMLVAWLPGSNGAVFAPYVVGQPIRLVLPAPIEIRGRVTLGGKSVASVASSFRVIAACQEKGRLNRVLSVDATAQADGSFLLAGLTPGVYRFQASRDGIWLSATQTVTVGGSTRPDIDLDLPEPGQAIDLHLTDRRGRPLAGASVTIARPDGPLTDHIWPKSLTADGAGILHLEGLNAGRETLTIIPVSDGSASPDGRKSTGPAATVSMDVPVFTVGAATVQKDVVCEN